MCSGSPASSFARGQARSPSCRPAGVVVSDGGRVVSLIYRRTLYGLVRMDEFAGYVDQIYFEKLVHVSDVTQVQVKGTEACGSRACMTWCTSPATTHRPTPRRGSPLATP